MTKLTLEEVKHIATLAKLQLSEDEINKFPSQLSSVLDHVGELSGVDTQGVKPTSQTTGLENVFRSDEMLANSTLTQDEATSGTDSIYNGYFKVKAVLENRSDK